MRNVTVQDPIACVNYRGSDPHTRPLLRRNHDWTACGSVQHQLHHCTGQERHHVHISAVWRKQRRHMDCVLRGRNMAIATNVNGSYVEPSSISVKVDGTWQDVSEVHCNVNGIWNKVWPTAKIYAVDIAVNTSDPYSRVSYPQTVTVGGKVYNNACYGYTPASGTTLNSWATDYDSGNGLISGIVPGTLGVSTQVFTPASTLTQIPAGSSSADAMTYFPTWYQYWNNDGRTIRIICCQEQLTSDFKDYAGSIGSDRKGHFYLGCYTCNSRYQSMTGAPRVSTTYQNFLSGCQFNGTNYDMMTWFQYEYLAMLCVFIWKSTDLQTAFAGGYVGGSSIQSNTALSTSKYGMAGTPGTSTTQKMAFFWIEDLWGNINQYIGGAYITSSYKLKLNTGLSSTSSWDLQTNQGPSGYVGGAINKVAGTTDSGFLPLDDGGSYTTYFADSGGVSPNGFAYVGGDYHNVHGAGPFNAHFGYTASSSNSNFGSRLSYRG